ncbi:MAG: YfbK domain-containing protein [Opitutaceae bacterium]
MKLLPEDPRLTAYALGEIEDSQERTEIEAAIAASPELQQAVAEIQNMGDLLGTSFAEELAPELSEFEKAKLEAAPAGATKPGRTIPWPLLSSVAAVLLLAVILIPQFRQEEATYTYQAPAREDTKADKQEALTPAQPLATPVVPDTTVFNETAQALSTVSTSETVITADFIPANKDMDVAFGIDQEATDSTAGGLISYEDFAKQNPKRNNKAQPEGMGIQIGSTYRQRSLDGDASTIAPATLPMQSAPATPKPKPVTRQLGFAEEAARSKKVVDHYDAALSAPRASSVRESLVTDFESNLDASVMRCMPVPPPQPSGESKSGFNTEHYDEIEETDFTSPLVTPLSTFSIDVDTASYANVRRFLNAGQLPPADAVRVEELINYFSYDDAAPTKSLEEGGDPFAVHMEQSIAPWNEGNRLLRIALKGYEMPWAERPSSNLVFLLDVSGSMSSANKLPLVKEAMQMLIRRLDKRDRVAIVVYAGASGLVLPSTTADNHETIEHALNNLKSGGSTNAGAGIDLAYKTARKHFIEGGNNRVILCTDGDFNVGQTNRGNLADIAEEQAEDGVSLTVLGFGMGNLKDGMLETLSNKGKGTYAYVDSKQEARKVFLEDLASNIFKIAKDVKIQVEFNPAVVKAYRLIGYENRRMKAEDFNNDAKKAGDIGPGHSIVALYEIVPPEGTIDLPGVDALKYQDVTSAKRVVGEVATVKLRYKQPGGDVSKLITRSVSNDTVTSLDKASDDLRFSAAVAGFGLRLMNSKYAGELSLQQIRKLALTALGNDEHGHRSDFTDLVRMADALEK